MKRKKMMINDEKKAQKGAFLNRHRLYLTLPVFVFAWLVLLIAKSYDTEYM